MLCLAHGFRGFSPQWTDSKAETFWWKGVVEDYSWQPGSTESKRAREEIDCPMACPQFISSNQDAPLNSTFSWNLGMNESIDRVRKRDSITFQMPRVYSYLKVSSASLSVQHSVPIQHRERQAGRAPKRCLLNECINELYVFY